MRAFKFRLATLLKLREAERQRRRAELAEAYRAEEILGEQAEQLNLQLEDIRRQSAVAVSPGRVDVDTILETHRYELQLKSQLGVLMQQSERIQQEIEQRRQVLVEADRQVRVLESLEDRQRQSHEHEMLKLETKVLDEVGIQARNEHGRDDA